MSTVKIAPAGSDAGAKAAPAGPAPKGRRLSSDGLLFQRQVQAGLTRGITK